MARSKKGLNKKSGTPSLHTPESIKRLIVRPIIACRPLSFAFHVRSVRPDNECVQQTPGPSIACPAFHCTPFPFACAVQISSQSLITLSFHLCLISADLTHSETSEERFVSVHVHAAVDVEVRIELVPFSLQFCRCKGSHTTHAHTSSADRQVSKVECCDVCDRRRARLRQAGETVLTGLDRHGQCTCSDGASVCSDDWDALDDGKTVSHLRTVVLAALVMMHGWEVH